MRDYENSDTSSFNTYRSGTENPRRELSTRTGYGSPASVTRRGSTFATADHFQDNSVWHQPNDYRDTNRNQQQRQDQNQYSNQSWGQHRNQNENWQSNQQNDYSNRQSNQSGSWQSNQQNRWPQDHRQHHSNYGNHSQDRDYDRHRSGDRNFFERAGDQVNQTWDRWTNDNDDNRQQTNRYSQNRSSYNAGDQNRYSSDYGYQNRNNQGRGYDEDRYSFRRNDYDNQHRRDEHDGEGFFDRVGNYISNAWHNLTQEEREDQERANRYRNNRWSDDDNRSYNRTSGNSGPPYNYGSSSRRDYEW